MNDDGSFNMFRDYQESTPSTWATAFALETLQEANVPDWRHVLYIDVNLLNRIAKWLCEQQDPDTGAFYDRAPVYDRKMVSPQIKICMDERAILVENLNFVCVLFNVHETLMFYCSCSIVTASLTLFFSEESDQ